MQKYLLAVLTLIFLVILSPVFMFSMLAPWAFGTILFYWSVFVCCMSLLIAGLYAYLNAELR